MVGSCGRTVGQVYCAAMRGRWALVALLLVLLQPVSALAGADVAPARDAAELLLETLTPEERVGQLFMVTFRGSDPGAEEAIFDLIANRHVSGVVLRTRNDNFVDAPDTIQSLIALVGKLQEAAYQASAPSEASGDVGGAYLPLLIGITQEGDGAPGSSLLSGVTDLPSEMAIGATWDPGQAEAVGAILGQELAALGVNLLLGPSLDVVEDPQPASAGDLGVRAFGGDPYWVSLMGEAFIRGVHAGSDGRVAVVAKHFPGHGGSDRPLEEEVATVRKSLAELVRIELAPFFAVTASAPGEDPSSADGMLTAPIRYQGFQENIRATTRPVSLDATAFGQVMALEPLATWHAAGGILMTDSLGSRAIRRFYDPGEQVFRGPTVARDAFLAGNDLLYLDSFRGSSDADEATTIRETLSFFVNRYESDPIFAEQVDQSVLRILRLKLRVFGSPLTYARVTAAGDASQIGLGGDVVQRVARQAATLVSPSQEELESRMAGSPRLEQRIVFFTDTRLVSQCTTCDSRPMLDTQGLESAILRLYGPGATGEVGGWNLTSYTMADLGVYFGEAVPSNLGLALTPAEEIDEALRTADWLVFSLLGTSEAAYGSNALKLLLDRRPDLVQAAHVVVFAFGVPYDLDATDISKIDVYYALHSKAAAFVEVAARLLFGELTATGASPVSIPGVGYDLIEATSPDAEQVISLVVSEQAESGTPEATPSGYTVGDVVVVSTGVILDHNGHAVPDGTVVEINASYPLETIPPMVLTATTARGVARAELPLERFGLLVITAASDPARVSEIVQLDVREGVGAFATVIAPSPEPTASPQATATVGAGAATPDEATSEQGAMKGGSRVAGLVLGLVGVALAVAMSQWQPVRVHFGKRTLQGALAALVGGLVLCNYLVWGLPGAAFVQDGVGLAAFPLFGFMGGAVGAAVDWGGRAALARARGSSPAEPEQVG